MNVTSALYFAEAFENAIGQKILVYGRTSHWLISAVFASFSENMFVKCNGTNLDNKLPKKDKKINSFIWLGQFFILVN